MLTIFGYIKDIDKDSLVFFISFVGGYIGLFIGTTIAQIPILIFKLHRWIKDTTLFFLGQE